MIRYEVDPPIVTIVLSRAKAKNAVDRETAEALADAFRRFDADDELAAAVFFGDHGTFCAGADLKAVAAGRPNRLDPQGDGPMGPSRMLLSKPVIAAVSGHAVAGGLELALWCDLRVVDEDAIFGVFCRRFGVPLIDGGTVRLPAIVGLGRALDLILTGRPVAADEALAMGLANRVVPPGTSRSRAEDLARNLAAFPQACLRSDRASVYSSLGQTLTDALDIEFAHGQAALASADLIAGATKFAGGKGRGGAFE